MHKVHILHTSNDDFWTDSLPNVIGEDERDYYEHIRDIACEYAKKLRVPATVEMHDPRNDGSIVASIFVDGQCNTQVIGEPVTW